MFYERAFRFFREPVQAPTAAASSRPKTRRLTGSARPGPGECFWGILGFRVKGLGFRVDLGFSRVDLGFRVDFFCFFWFWVKVGCRGYFGRWGGGAREGVGLAFWCTGPCIRVL